MTQTVWIKTEPSVDGKTYVVSVAFSDDRSIVLTPDSSLRYASAVLAAAQRAEYDAAVFKQMRKLVDVEHAAQLIIDLRRDRPLLDSSPLAPMRLEPGVNSEAKPFLAVFIDDQQVGQWDVPDAREHALGVLEAVTAAELDAGYFRALVGIINLDEARARHVIEDVGLYRS